MVQLSLGTSGAIMGQIIWSSSSNGTAQNSSQVTASIQVKKKNKQIQPKVQQELGQETLILMVIIDNFSIRKEVSKKFLGYIIKFYNNKIT